MTESDYWLSLEFRLCREFARFPQNELRFLWCDGLQSEPEIVFQDKAHWICGIALISESDGKTFINYRFRLRIGPRMTSRENVDWGALLPDEESSGWLKVDRQDKRIEIMPPTA